MVYLLKMVIFYSYVKLPEGNPFSLLLPLGEILFGEAGGGRLILGCRD